MDEAEAQERARLSRQTRQALIDQVMALQAYNKELIIQRDQARYIVSITRRCKVDWMRSGFLV